jgi:hypothetical protein
MSPESTDRGAASLTIVLVAPLLVVLMFVGFQAAMWNHARTEARVVAREGAVLVARDGLAASQAQVSVLRSLTTDNLLTDPTVSIARTATSVVVTVTGRAPGLLRGTSAPIAVTVTMPVEGWVPL